MAHQYGAFAGLTNSLTSELGLYAGQETYKYIAQNLQAYIAKISDLQQKIIQYEKNPTLSFDTERTLKEAYATIMQVRELLTGDQIQYQVFTGTAGSKTSHILNLNTQQILENTSLSTLTNNLRLNNINQEQALRLLKSNIGTNTNLFHRSDYFELGDHQQSFLQAFNERYNELVNRNRSRTYTTKQAITRRRRYNPKTGKYQNDFIPTSWLGKPDLESLTGLNEGELIESVSRYTFSRENNARSYLLNYFNRNNAPGVQSGDISHWQIKGAGATLLQTSAIRKNITDILNLFQQFKQAAQGSIKNQEIIQQVQSMFTNDASLTTQIENTIENSVNSIINNFSADTGAVISGNW